MPRPRPRWRALDEAPYADDVSDPDSLFAEDYNIRWGPTGMAATRAREQLLVETLRDPAARQRFLSTLSGEAVLLLRLACEIQWPIGQPVLREEAALLLGPGGAARAEEELLARGLLSLETWSARIGVGPGVAVLLLPVLPLLDEPEAGPGDSQHELPQTLAALPRDLALLGVALRTVRPRRKQTGEVYKRDEERLAAVLGERFRLREVLQLLLELGLNQPGEVLLLSESGEARLAALQPVDIVRHQLSRDGDGARQHVWQMLRAGAARGPGRSWFSRAALERAARVGYLGQGQMWQRHSALLQMAAHTVKDILRSAALQHCAGRTRLWPAVLAEQAPVAQAPVKVHLQPSFEVLVPPEAPAGVVVELGQVAELLRVDQVSTMRLTKAAVIRAAERGLGAGEMLALLERHAHAGVPQNVAMSLKDWVRQAGQVRMAQGLVLILGEEAERTVLVDPQLQPYLVRSLGRGVFLLEAGTRAQVDKRLKALGLTLPADVLRAEDCDDPPPPDAWPLPAALPEGPPGELKERAAAARAAARAQMGQPG